MDSKQRAVLHNYLKYDFFPPIRPGMYPVIEKAIEHANAEEWDAVVVFPDGTEMTVEQVVEDYRLAFFIPSMNEDDEDLE